MEDLRYQGIIDHLILEGIGNGKEIALRVSGKSMRPLIRQGDSIRIERCAPGNLAMGDIITYKRHGTYYTHRLLKTVRRGKALRLITKGDNEINVDPPVSPDNILGRVAVIQKKNRTLYLNTPFWRFMNYLLGMIFLLETICVLFYRSAVGESPLLGTLLPATTKPSLLYRHLKTRCLHLACFMLRVL